MSDLFERGIDCFNRGLWFEAHEIWEDLWNATEGETRLFYQGLVQVAVGLHHLSRGNLRGGRRVLERGLLKLQEYPAGYAGIDNRRLTIELESALRNAAVPTIRVHPSG